MSKRQPRLFMTYSHTDRDLGEDIARRLKRLYDYVFYDQNLTGGQLWWKTILEQIADCDILVFLMDQASLESDYCWKELKEALRREKKILPVMLAPEIKIPEDLAELNDIQFVKMTQGMTADALDDLFRALVAIERRMILSPSPVAPPDVHGDTPRRDPSPRRIVIGLILLVALVAVGGVGLNMLNRSGTPTAIPVLASSAATIQVAAARTDTATPVPSITGSPTVALSDKDSAATLIALHLTQTAASMPTPDKAQTAARIAFQTETAMAIALWTKTPTASPTATPTAFGGGSGLIAFGSSRDGRYQVYTMNLDGSDQRNRSRSAVDDLAPTWSPDGKLLVFSSERDQRWQIYVMNADGTGQRNLSNTHANERNATWSPDGKQIAFYSDRDGHEQIYVMNADGSDQHNLSKSVKDDWNPAWSSDARQIAFFSNRDGHEQIYVINADGTNQRNLSNNGINDWFPQWQP